MIKFILNKFSKTEDIKDEPLEVSIEPSNEELLQEALNVVLKDKLRQQLLNMCYTEKQLSDQKAAWANRNKLKINELMEKFPDACYYCSSYNGKSSLSNYEFNINKFIDRLIENSNDIIL
jgi:hypothetical protein